MRIVRIGVADNNCVTDISFILLYLIYIYTFSVNNMKFYYLINNVYACEVIARNDSPDFYVHCEPL
jgi:hypothetical protein